MVQADDVEQITDLDDVSRRQILQDAGLFINDPSTFPNLSEVLDPTAGLDNAFRPVAYNTTVTTLEKVRCSICEQRQLHNHGFIVRIATGEVGLVGKDCGERYFFGEDGWKLLEANSRIASDRAIFQRQWGPAKAALTNVLSVVQQWETRLRVVRQLQYDFQTSLPELYRAIASKQHDGRLSIERRIELPYVTPSGEQRIRIEYVPTMVCEIGAAWFFMGTDLCQNLQIQARALQTCISQLNPDIDSKAVVALTGKLREIRKNFQDIATKQALLPRLFSKSTLEKITTWARQEKVGPANYRVRNGKIKCSDDHYEHYVYVIADSPNNLDECWIKVRSEWPRL